MDANDQTVDAPPAFVGRPGARLLELIKGADTVELKLTVPESDQQSTVAALGMDPLEAQIRQVFFFDTPELTLDKNGVVVRARRFQGKGDDSVVKLRPVDPAELPDKLRRSASFRVEVDALPGGFVCSGALKGTPGSAAVRTMLAGGLPLRKLFSKEQRQFFAAHAPAGISLDDLTTLGPIFVLKLRFTPQELAAGSSARCGCIPTARGSSSCRRDAQRTRRSRRQPSYGRSWPRAACDISGNQETKTRKALKYFARAANEET